MTDFKSWEELSERERLECTYSDAYKDAYGFRPRGVNIAGFTLEELQHELEVLGVVIQKREAELRDAEAAAERDFEARVAEFIALGAKDRATALRWIMEADEVNPRDWDALCYVNGLRYGYFGV